MWMGVRVIIDTDENVIYLAFPGNESVAIATRVCAGTRHGLEDRFSTAPKKKYPCRRASGNRVYQNHAPATGILRGGVGYPMTIDPVALN